jgi:hypothetical protein
MAVSDLKTLQSLYKAGVNAPPPVVMSWSPIEQDLHNQLNTLSMINDYIAPEAPTELYDPARDEDGHDQQPRTGRRRASNKRIDRFDDSFSSMASNFGGEEKKKSGWGGWFGKKKTKEEKGEKIWLESRSSFPMGNKKKVIHFHEQPRVTAFQEEGNNRPGKNYGPPRANYGSAQARVGKTPQRRRRHGAGNNNAELERRLGKGKKEKTPKGTSIWLQSGSKFPGSSSSQGLNDHQGFSSSSSGGFVKPKKQGGCYCSIGRTEKGDDAALITLGSIGIPLAIAGTIFGGSFGGNQIQQLIDSVSTAIQQIIQAIGGLGGRRRRMGVDGTPADSSTASKSRHMLFPILTWPIRIVERYRNYFGWAGNAVENLGRSFQDSFVVHVWKLMVSNGFSRSCNEARGEPITNEINSHYQK